jgi:hypothetical protein
MRVGQLDVSIEKRLPLVGSVRREFRASKIGLAEKSFEPLLDPLIVDCHADVSESRAFGIV